MEFDIKDNKYGLLGPVASNYGNPEKHRYLPWFKGRYGLHANVNSKEGGKGENRDGKGDGNGEIGPTGTERGKEQREGEVGVSGEGRGAEAKNGDPSEGNV